MEATLIRNKLKVSRARVKKWIGWTGGEDTNQMCQHAVWRLTHRLHWGKKGGNPNMIF